MKINTINSTVWKYLITEIHKGKTIAKPLWSPEEILSWKGTNNDFDFYVEAIENGQWRCFKEHEARAYLIITPNNKSIVWITWLGNRGCQWHVPQHFPIENSKITKAAKNIANQLIENYQEIWNEYSNYAITEK
jgi:hypothetical protein